MRLITGPLRSGKTGLCVDEIRDQLRLGSTDWWLLVPTATLAEHLRNQLAREGFVFPPGNIRTLAKFVDEAASDLPPASRAAVELATEHALTANTSTRFAAVSDLAGIRRSIASTIEEFCASGGVSANLPPAASDFADILKFALALLAERGLHLQSERILRATSRVSARPTASNAGTNFVPIGLPSRIWVAGFYSFSIPEVQLLRALAAKTRLTVALCSWSGSAAALNALLPGAAEHLRLDSPAPSVRPELFTANQMDGEVSEIVRRILEHHRNGRPWREIAIVVRTENPYVPLLRDTLARFNVPARFYFAPALKAQPLVRYLASVIEALLSGWDGELLLETLRSAGSPLEHDDRFEYAVRERMPCLGIDPVASLADLHANPDHARDFFNRLASLDPWRSAIALPETWASRFASLVSLCAPPHVRDRVPHSRAELLRSDAAALQAWGSVVAETAVSLPAKQISCSAFWHALQIAMDSADLRVPDHRRDVVHVLDAFEARQWSAPVVFICGLVERQFPKHHSEDPILPESVRLELQSRGIPIRTTAERQAEERFLFQNAVLSATRQAVLSFPLLNAKADANLASFLIDSDLLDTAGKAVDVRPASTYQRAPEPLPRLADEALLTAITRRFALIRATAIESYLQCPFQFFADQTLRLKGPPADPFDRLNLPAQGTLVHKVLEYAGKHDKPIPDVFDSVFSYFCDRHRVPHSYRTEAVRLELLHNLECLAADPRLAHSGVVLYEQDVDLPIDELTRITGRIDRIDIDPHGRAVIIDYKYQSKASLKRTRDGHDNLTHVQGGLYLLALPRLGDYTPAGMVYCGMKREVTFGGWIMKPLFIHLDQGCEVERLEQVMQSARELSLQALASIRSGRIAPQPADEARCAFCASAAICRVEMATAETAVTVAGGATQ